MKLAVIVAFALMVTVVAALLALAIVAELPVTVQLTNLYPLAAVADMLTGVFAAWLPAPVTLPPAVGLRLIVSVCVAGIDSKLARIVAFALKVTVVVTLLALANVAVPLTTVQLTNLEPLAGAADMLTGVPALTVCAPDGVTVPPVVGFAERLSVNVCAKLAVIVAFALKVTVVAA
jgi:hypothetical protein